MERLLLLLWVVIVPGLDAATHRLTRAQLLDKIRGGWAGQMIGVSYGAPTEFQSNGRIGTWDLQWKPEMLDNAIEQDDLYVEMTFSRVMDSLGLEATCEDYGEAFKTSQYHVWHANAGARRALNLGVQAPGSGHPSHNFHANDIDFQIEADFIGLMCPGLPRESNRYCDRVGRVMNYGDGLYGGMFVCGMYAAAYFEQDPRRVVQAGLACLPSRSKYARLIRDLLDASARTPDDWRGVWQIIQNKWDVDDSCPEGALSPFNIDAKLNGAYIAFGLLFGGGDLLKTMEISTRCGQDSDCNPSSAAGVLGVILGYDRIPAVFKASIPKLENRKFAYTDYSLNEIVRSTEQRALHLIRRAGGVVTDSEVIVPVQKPRAAKLEQWTPGIPDRKVGVREAGWSFQGSWTDDKEARVATAPGSEATFTFEGVALALLGRLTQEGGRADVYLDGRKAGVADGFIVERTYDNVLWHTYGLKPGRHTLRVVTVADRDLRSRGNAIALVQAVVYRAAR